MAKQLFRDEVRKRMALGMTQHQAEMIVAALLYQPDARADEQPKGYLLGLSNRVT